jgi:predicted Zn-dependent protease
VQGQREDNRYYHNKLGFSFAHPPTWQVTAGAQQIVASAPDGSATLSLTIRRRDQASSPRKVLETGANGALSDGAELDQAGLQGYTAIASSGGNSSRLAVIDYGGLSYLFDGKAGDFPAADPQLLASIQSFRPLHPKERRAAGDGYRIHYIQVPSGATMASLAASVRIPDAEAQLRLLNGLYPRGEPRTGDWIKMIE